MMIGGEGCACRRAARHTAQVDDDSSYRYAQGLFQSDQRPTVRLRCPRCRHQGTLEPPPGADVYNGQAAFESTWYLVRRCPNTDCHAVIFVMSGVQGDIKESMPAETLEWDATNLKPEIKETLEEAVLCFSASCFRASAIMARRTLELVCDDQSATGANLKARIQALGQNAVVPTRLFAALDNLRLLGNDAAHVEAKDYLKVGADEARLAIDVAKEVLKAVYQYDDLVTRLEALKG